MQEAWQKLYDEAKKVLNPRDVSKMIEAGGVAAAIETVAGNIYVGVCVDTACTLGVCAERNAIFNMITNGESTIKRVLAINSEGEVVSPCGACRELMVQLMPNGYQNIEVLLDKKSNRLATLKELTPQWWL